MRHFLAACAGLVFLSFAGHAFTQKSAEVESCAVGVRTYTFHLPDQKMSVARLNGILARYLRKNPGFDTPWSENRAIPAQAEVVRIEFERTACNSSGDANMQAEGPDIGIFAVGGCSQIGCVGNLPLEFTGDPGDTVSITTCSASTGIQETGSFEMNAEGLWIMTSHNEIMVTSCQLNP